MVGNFTGRMFDWCALTIKQMVGDKNSVYSRVNIVLKTIRFVVVLYPVGDALFDGQ